MTREEFKSIFETNFDAVRNYVYYRCGDKELATDIAQDSFLKLWEKSNKFTMNNPKALLFKISSDIFVSNYRRKKVEMDFNLSMKQEAETHTPEEILKFNELKSSYNAVLKQMPEKQRTVFLMHRLDGMKYSEIAGCLKLSQKAIEKRMKLALDFLRNNLNN